MYTLYMDVGRARLVYGRRARLVYGRRARLVFGVHHTTVVFLKREHWFEYQLHVLGGAFLQLHVRQILSYFTP